MPALKTVAWMGFGVIVGACGMWMWAARGTRSTPDGTPVQTPGSASLGAQTAGSGPRNAGGLAYLRVQHLRRGINLSNWYTQKDFASARPNAYMSVSDMRTLKKLGFDHVRLSIDPEQLIADAKTGELKPRALARLDRTVSDLTGAGLNVVLDVQPLDSWKALLATDDGAGNFFAFWTAFATHYAKTDPEKVFFEVLNEPLMADPYRWAGIQAQAVGRIRGAAPQHTVIATAGRYDNIEGLLAMEPVRDDNVIYTFHDYDPMWFTHQGATWGTAGWAFLRGVPYPSSPENTKTLAQQEPDEPDRLQVKRFAAERWDASRIALDVAAVAAWAKQRGVPLYCGEFGVYKAFADPQSRVRWIYDMRSVLESKNIAWAMWDYDGNFGLMTKDNYGTEVDQDALHALGLSK